jgi:hypothetical protein
MNTHTERLSRDSISGPAPVALMAAEAASGVVQVTTCGMNNHYDEGVTRVKTNYWGWRVASRNGVALVSRTDTRGDRESCTFARTDTTIDTNKLPCCAGRAGVEFI